MTVGTSVTVLSTLTDHWIDQITIITNLKVVLENNSTTNSTSLRDELPSFISNVSSLSNSGLFLVSFSIFLIIVGYSFFLKGRKTLIKRNQRVLIGLVTAFVIIQMIALIFRVIYNGISLNYNLHPEIEIVIEGLFIFTQLCAMLETLIVEVQSITIFVLMGFIMNVFLKTVHNAGSMSKKQFTIMKIVSNILTITSSLLTLILVIIIAITNFMVKIHAAQFNQTIVYVLTLVVFIIEVTIMTVLYVYFGVRVLRTIKQRSLKLKQESNRNAFVNSIQKPLTKTLVLLISMGVSSFFQVLAAIASVLASSFSSDSNVVSYFLNSFGILLFAGCVVLMYNPLLSDEYNNIDLYEAKERERQLLLNETSSMGSELSSPRPSFFTNSPRHHNKRTSQQFPNEYSTSISRIVSESSMMTTSSTTLIPPNNGALGNQSHQQQENSTSTQEAIEENRKSIVVSLVNLKDIVSSPPNEEGNSQTTLPSVGDISITSPSTTTAGSENQQF